MKVLFYPIYITTPHFETELELMLKHIKANDEVFVLQCKENFYSCLLNPNHLKSICYYCKSKFDKGISILNYELLKILNFENVPVDYSVIPKSFNSIKELSKFKIDNINIGLAAGSTIISRKDNENDLNTKLFVGEIEVECKTALYVYHNFKFVVQKIKPDIVYLFNGRFSTVLPAIEYCEQIALPFYIHERGGVIDRYLTCKNTMPHDTDVTQQEMEKIWRGSLYEESEKIKIGSSFFIDRRNKMIQAWHSFTADQQKDLLPSSLDKRNKIITIYNSTIGEYASVRGWEDATLFFQDEYSGLQEIFNYYKDRNDIQFYLRIHPNLANYENSQKRYLYNLINIYANVEIILPDSSIDSYALMENSDKILVFGSTMGIEAAFWNKPVILMGKSSYDKLGCCFIPKNFEEVVNMIDADLLPKSKLGSIKYGFWQQKAGIKYEYYKPETLFSGKFLNKEIKLSFVQLFKMLFMVYYDLFRGNKLTDFYPEKVSNKKLLIIILKKGKKMISNLLNLKICHFNDK
jgi:hypothetical protein